MSDLFEQHLRASFGYHAETLDTDAAEARLAAYDYGRPSGHRRLWAALGASGTLVAGGAVATVLLVSSAPSSALAAWTRVPTKPTPAAVAHARAICSKDYGASTGIDDKPVLAEARGKWVALITAVPAGSNIGGHTTPQPVTAFCITDGHKHGVGGVGAGSGIKPGPDEIDEPYMGGIGGRSWWVGGKSSQKRLLQLRNEHKDRQAMSFQITHTRTQTLATSTMGAAGRNVSGITFGFTNGRTVVATVENGYYLALWPWNSDPTKVYITTSSGTRAFDWPGVEQLMGLPSSESRKAVFEETLRRLLRAHTSPNTLAGGTPGPHGRMTIYVTRDSYNSLKTAIAHSSLTKNGVSSVKVVEVAHSMRALGRVQNQILDNSPTIRTDGITIHIGPVTDNPATNTVDVKVPNNVAAAQRYMNRKFGRGIVTVEHQRISHHPRGLSQ